MLEAFASLDDVRVEAVSGVGDQMLCTRKHPFTLRRHHRNSQHVQSKASHVGLRLEPRVPEFEGVYPLVFAIGGHESLVVIGGYLRLGSKLLMLVETTESVV